MSHLGPFPQIPDLFEDDFDDLLNAIKIPTPNGPIIADGEEGMTFAKAVGTAIVALALGKVAVDLIGTLKK